MAYSLDYYKNYLRNTRSKIETRNRQNAKLRREIEELRRAYNAMKSIKDNYSPCAKDIKNDVKHKNMTSGLQWRGKSKTEYDNTVKNGVKSAASSFYNSIDDMLDQISTVISRKQGELDSGNAILNGLNKTCRWLEGVIRNWVN